MRPVLRFFKTYVWCIIQTEQTITISITPKIKTAGVYNPSHVKENLPEHLPSLEDYFSGAAPLYGQIRFEKNILKYYVF